MRWTKNPVPLHAVIGGAGKTCASHLIRNVLEAGLGREYGLITTRHAYLGGDVLPPPLGPAGENNWTRSWSECVRQAVALWY